METDGFFQFDIFINVLVSSFCFIWIPDWDWKFFPAPALFTWFWNFKFSPHIFSCTYQQTQNICITCIQCWANVGDVGPTLYKCYPNVLCLLEWWAPPCTWKNVVEIFKIPKKKIGLSVQVKFRIAVHRPPCQLVTPPNVGFLMLGHCRRRWPNINPTLNQLLMF